MDSKTIDEAVGIKLSCARRLVLDTAADLDLRPEGCEPGHHEILLAVCAIDDAIQAVGE